MYVATPIRTDLVTLTGRVRRMPDAIYALRSSVDRLGGLVGPLDDTSLSAAGPIRPSGLSPMSCPISVQEPCISLRRLLATLDDTEPPDDFNQRIWDEWNAKSPREKAKDGLAADAQLMAALEEVGPEDRARFKSAMGPLELDWDAFIGMRLNEHLLHEWDVAVALDANALLAQDGTEVVIDNLELIARFTSKQKGDPRTIMVSTIDPERSFVVTIKPDQVEFTSVDPADEPEISMPAESFIRLVYGRLDPAHTPLSVVGERALLDQLRSVFPGP